MKKVISLFLTVFVLMIAGAGLSGDVSAYAVTSGDFEYIVLEDGTAEIIGYTGTDTALEIPSELDGYTVTSIGEAAFENGSSLEEITIPAGVTSISSSAFEGCSSLSAIHVDENNTVYSSENGVLFNQDETEQILYSASTSQISVYAAVSSDFSYDVLDDGTAEITGYTGSDTVLEIPSEIDGYTVTSIGYQAFYNCSSLTEITIPDSVTSIGNYAFYKCTGLTEITIPDSVTSIGNNYVFYSCTGLTAINVDENNTAYSSQDGVLFNKDKTRLIQYPIGNERTSYTILDSVTSIGSYAFYGCTSLTKVTIPDSVTSMGQYAFANCTSLSNITIPNSVTSIGYSVFNGCTSLTEVTISDSVTSIGQYAFNGCTSLIEITIPDSVTSIGSYAFYGCSSLTAINVDENNTVYSSQDGVLFNKDKTELMQYPAGNERTSYTVPDSVTSIGDYAFQSCTKLTEIIIPNSVTSIGDDAFRSCTSLTEITIPDSVTSIGEWAFAQCRSLTEITIPDGVTSIGEGAFRYCYSLTKITIPNSVTSIGWSAFSNCTSLTDVYYTGTEEEWNAISIDSDNERLTNATIHYETENVFSYTVLDDGTAEITGYTGSATVLEIPSEIDGYTVTSIGYQAFYNCSSLTEITIPDSVTSIGEYAFSNCGSLTAINVDENNAAYSSQDGVLFNKDKTELIQYPIGNERTSYTIPDSVTSIGFMAFAGCTSLTGIMISDSVTSIGDGAFGFCVSLTEITIPNSVTSIGAYVFYYCTGLTEITIPDSVTSIGNSAFRYCTSLTDVYYAGSEEEWNAISIDSYNECLTNANVFFYTILDNGTAEITGYTGSATVLEIPSEIGGYTVTSIGYQAFYYCSSLTEITIPDGITSIGYGAFYSCSSLTEITIPDSVTSIGSYAFRNCRSLTEITIPDSVTSIDDYVFYQCSGLTNVTIPNSITSIGHAAFGYCTSLTEITIPDSVINIDDYAFYRCNSLTNVTIGNNVTSIGREAFYRCISLTNVTFGNSVTSIGLHAFSYCTSLTEITIPDSVTSIGTYAFRYCTNLTSVTFGNGVTSTGRYAFYGCSSLTNVTFGNSVTSIGSYSFYECTSLTNITIPDSVTSIGSYSFYGCTGLTNITIPDSVTSIGSYSFWGCESLVEITIPDSVTSMGEYVFAACSNLTNVIIGNGVTSIGSLAFGSCTSLTVITIPDSVMNISYGAFSGCTSLSDVYYAGSEKEWNAIYISSSNTYLTNATIHYNSSGPSDSSDITLYFETTRILMDVGETYPLTVYLGDEPVNDLVTWYYVSDRLTIDENYVITAVEEGIARVSVMYISDEYGALYASCTIYVGDPNSAEYTITYDTKQYYYEGGFYSTVSSISDCVELYVLLENSIADSLASGIGIDNWLEEYPDSFKEISPVTLTATVSGSGLSFSRDSLETTYTAEFDSIEVKSAVDDLLMLYPYDLSVADSGNTYTVTITLESESFDTITDECTFTVENLATKSANEHISFLSSNTSYSNFKRNFGSGMIALKDDLEYQWTKITTLNFDNYYEIVLADILIEMLDASQSEVSTLSSLVPDAISEWASSYKTFLSGFTTVINEVCGTNFKLFDLNVDKILKKSKYTTDGVYTNDEIYQMVLDMFGNAENAQKITNLFAAVDKTKQVYGFIKYGDNVLESVIEWSNKIAVFNAYSNAEDAFKEVMQTFADSIPDSETQMKEAIYNYINYDASIAGQAEVLLDSFSDMLTDITLETFKTFVGKSLTKYLASEMLDWIGSISLTSGTFASTAAFSTVSAAFGGFFTGVSIGLKISDVICSSSSLSVEMSKVVAMSEYSQYILATLYTYESKLYSERSNDAVDCYEYAFSLHKAAQSYIMSHTVSALDIKRDSIIIRLFGKDDYDGLINEILSFQSLIDNLYCHLDSGENDTLEIRTKIISIKCPVDVYLYDENGDEIVRIIDDVKEYVADGIYVVVSEGEKFIAVPADQEYSIKIIATDSGTMEYSISEYDAGTQKVRSVKIQDIPLVTDRVFTGTIDEGLDVDVESYTISSDAGSFTPNIIIDNPVTGIVIDKTELILLSGDTAQLTATVSPQDATDISVKWYSDDPSIATVDENGVVTAVSSGTTQIYVVTEDGGYYAMCEVTVESTVILGDVTGDGIIDAADVVMVQRYDAGLITLSAEQLEAADVTGDGIVDAADVVMIQRYDAGLISSL